MGNCDFGKAKLESFTKPRCRCGFAKHTRLCEINERTFL